MRNLIDQTGEIMLRFLHVFLAVLLGAMILDVLLGVVSRYLFGSQVVWTEELACFLLIWIGLTGAAAAFAKNAHLGLDVLVHYFDGPARKKAKAISCLVCIAFTVFVFLVGGAGLTRQAFDVNRILPAMQISDGFIYLALPVSGVFMLVFQIRIFLRTVCDNAETSSGDDSTQAG